MVSYEHVYMDSEQHVCHVRCLNTDEKPHNVGPNSDLIEFYPDTGEIKLYFYVNNEWIEVNT